MALTIIEAASRCGDNAAEQRLLSMFSQPHPRVEFNDDWDYAVFGLISVGRRQNWKIEGGRFIASIEEVEWVEDDEARQELEALIDTWEAEGKEAIVAYFRDDEREDGFDWSQLRVRVVCTEKIDQPLTHIAFFKYPLFIKQTRHTT